MEHGGAGDASARFGTGAALWHARVAAPDAPGRGESVGGGAAPFGPPERWRRHADARGADSGVRATARDRIRGEVVEERTPHLAVAVDLDGEKRRGGAPRRRPRRPPRREREEGEGGGCEGDFTKKSSCFS